MPWNEWSGPYTYAMLILGAGILLFCVSVISFIVG